MTELSIFVILMLRIILISPPSWVMDVRHLEEVSKAQKKAVENKELKPRSLFGDISNNLAKEGIIVRSSEMAVIRSVQRARRAAGGQWPLPKSFREAIRFLPDQLCYAISGDFLINFFLFIISSLENMFDRKYILSPAQRYNRNIEY